MFTGLIEETGIVSKIETFRNQKRISIKAVKILSDLEKGDSVSVNGACQTVVNISEDIFTVEAIGETLSKTTLNYLIAGDEVNLERALQIGDRLGGHMVQGHINGIGQVSEITKRGEGWLLQINIGPDLSRYIVSEGSIAVDGISFTVAEMNINKININLIPHTYQNTTIKNLHFGSKVNIEVDILAKYIEKLVNDKNSTDSSVENWLEEKGW